MKSALAQVIVVGTFPYPIHGAAFVNSLMHELFQSRIKRTKRIDTSVHVLGSYYAAKRRTMKRMFYLFSRLLVFCRGYFVLVTSILREGRGRSLVYIGLSAGAALRFDLLYVKTSCLLGAVVVLHHHSFKYVETADRYMNLMTSLHGNLTHLFLCSKMAQVMNELYPNLKEQSWRVVGNSWILPTSWSSSPEENQSKVTGGLTIGLLSNLSREKGFFRLIDIFEDLVRVGFNVRLKVAGTAEHEVASAIEDLIESHGSRVTFTGAIVGEQKRTWYRGIDVFVFPSTLTEAYPLVMVESLASGVPFFEKEVHNVLRHGRTTPPVPIIILGVDP